MNTAATAISGVDVITISADVTEEQSVQGLLLKIEDKKIDVLVNNAGLALGKAAFDAYDFSDFETMIETNITGFLRIAHGVIPFLRTTRGHIVNLSSIAGIEAYEGGSVYCASKAFVSMISKNLRIDLAGSGIRVTDIAPGAVETDFSNVRFKGDAEKAAAVYRGYEPLQPEDIADCIAFAVSRPVHVNIDHMLIMPTAQASAGRIVKR